MGVQAFRNIHCITLRLSFAHEELSHTFHEFIMVVRDPILIESLRQVMEDTVHSTVVVDLNTEINHLLTNCFKLVGQFCDGISLNLVKVVPLLLPVIVCSCTHEVDHTTFIICNDTKMVISEEASLHVFKVVADLIAKV